MPSSRLYIVLFVSLLAGCLAQPQTDRTETKNSTLVQAFDGIQFNDCSGLGTSLPIPTNSDTQPPAGWSGSDSAITFATLSAYQCERIHVGSFERGPRTFLIETHNNEIAPENCTSGGPNGTWILTKFVIDDQEIVSVLLQNGIPAAVGEFTWGRDSLGIVDFRSVSFSLNGSASSTLMNRGREGTSTTERGVDRYFWQAGLGINFLDVSSEQSYDGQGGSLLFEGHVQEPFIYARYPEGISLGGGTAYQNAQFGLSLHRYGDMECKKPL